MKITYSKTSRFLSINKRQLPNIYKSYLHTSKLNKYLNFKKKLIIFVVEVRHFLKEIFIVFYYFCQKLINRWET